MPKRRTLLGAAAAALVAAGCGREDIAVEPGTKTGEAVLPALPSWAPDAAVAAAGREVLGGSALRDLHWVSYGDAYDTPPDLANMEKMTIGPRTVVVHHAAGYEGDPLAGARKIRADHMAGSRGEPYADIGYNLVVGWDESQGRIVLVEGRSPEYRGAHTYGMNNGTYGICLLGDHSVVPPGAGYLQAIVVATALAAHRFGIDVTGQASYELPKQLPPFGKEPSGPMFRRSVAGLTTHRELDFYTVDERTKAISYDPDKPLEERTKCPGRLQEAIPRLRTVVDQMTRAPRFRQWADTLPTSAFRTVPIVTPPTGRGPLGVSTRTQAGIGGLVA